MIDTPETNPVQVSSEELAEKTIEAFQRGILLGIKIGKRELDESYPTHLFAVDEPTAQIYNLPFVPPPFPSVA